MNKKTEKKSNKVIGIDLGTTNSVVSYVPFGSEKPEILVNRDGDRTTPSVVCLKKKEIIVGKEAKSLSLILPDYVISSVKTLTGQNKKVKLGDKEYSVPEIQAMILGYLTDYASKFLGEKINRVVITVPAYFNDNQRRLTEDAGKIAGLKVERIINEPTAAALAYGLGNPEKDEEEKNVLVFDLGGGTFDVSVINIDYAKNKDNKKEGIFQVLSTRGDTKLGGDDFDQIIFDFIRKKFLQKTNIDIENDINAKQRVKLESEKIKKKLSNSKSVDINLPFLYQNKEFSGTITRSEFEYEFKLRKFDTKIKKILELSIKDSKLKQEEIDEVLLVGGSTRIPIVQKMIEDIFTSKKVRRDNPDEVVAMGAAIQASILSGKYTSKIVLIDATPLTLGIAVQQNLMHVLIPRNKQIPCSASDEFTTAVDNQPSVTISVYQGESPLVKNNKLLGEFILSNIQPAKAGVPKIKVKFNIDENSILSVHAQDLQTKAFKEIKIHSNTQMSKEEIAKKIEEYNQRKEEDEQEKNKLLL